jgi:signal transduction histidine kinase/ActR/RegA family two-component response regulator
MADRLRRWIPVRRSVAYFALLVGVAMTLLGTYYVVRAEQTREFLRFQTAAEEARHLIEIRLNTYIELLRATSALFAANANVSRTEFRTFFKRLRVRERYPGIQGLGFAIRVSRADVADPGRRLDRLRLEEIRVWPPGERDEYTCILYLEPLDDRNRAAIGYDMFTEPIRRAAMERARDSGDPTASGKVTLVQEIGDDKQPGFLIYMPVYRNSASLNTPAQRRAALTGYVYSPFRAGDLLQGIFGEHSSVQLQVYDGERPTYDALLHSSAETITIPAQSDWTIVHTLSVAGRTWTLQFTGAPLSQRLPPEAVRTLWLGIPMSVMLFAVMFLQVRAWEVAARHANELRTSEEALRQSEARLRRLVVLERDARAQAQAADRAKDEFLATLSHELRTPLNAMLGWITMLRAGKVREERRANAFEVIERNARTQAQLIEDLLDVSRIITGKVRLELEPLQLGPIAHAALDALRPGADAKRVHVHVSVSAETPTIMGDPSRLQQIVWNLLANAIKFTPPGGAVSMDVAQVHHELVLTIRDTGVGIDPEFLPHVFERFRQADSSTTRTHSGVGLGLAITRHLVELHGGSISAQSEGKDRGAEFVVRLPTAGSENALSPMYAPATDVPIILNGLRILVVDDDLDTRELLGEALSATGATVIAVSSAAEALNVLSGGGADAIVSDISMPDTDGYLLIRQIRSLSSELARIPAIALTAYARPDDRRHALDAGFQVHLSKPVDLEALKRALAWLVRTSLHASG